jgi:hypothetical protein
MVRSTTTMTSTMDAVQQLARQREEIVREFSQLTEADCRAPAQWGGIQRNVNFLLRAFSLHELDHLQHLHKLLAARGVHFSEPQILLSKAQALRAELMALVLSLSDEEFDQAGPGHEDWSVHQLIEHLQAIDAGYADNIRKSAAAAREATTTAGG